LLSTVGLGLMAGAVLHGIAGAQVPDSTRARRDSIARRDSLARRDSIARRDTSTRRDTTLTIPARVGADSLLRDSLAKRDTVKKVPRDTIKAPLAHSELPQTIEIGRRLYWNRDSVLATGAITLADLLERVPGMTTLHAGWIAAPAVGAYMGDVRRIRVYYDGVELGALDPRGQDVLDLTQVNLWSVEDAVVEPTADEVRVYLRSWRVRNTTPETRTDVATGDQQTNLYRGFFGKRLDNGLAIQFGAQQYGTTPPSVFGTSSDQTGIVGRVGWAKRDWSVDGFATRISRHRGTIFGETSNGFVGSTSGDSIPSVESTRSDAYLRVAYRDPDESPFWAQVMASGSKYGYTGIRTVPTTGLVTHEDSVLAVAPLDTNVFRAQYIASAGVVRGALRASVTQRVFGSGGKHIAPPSIRASFVTDRLSVSGFAESTSEDSISHSDLTAQFTPLSFVSVVASAGRVTDSRIANDIFTANYLRGEAGLRVKSLWLIGGILRRDSVRLSPPRVFDTTFTARREPAATGTTVAIRGKLWRLINADVSAIRWSDTLGLYRPRYQTRTELFIRSNFLERFPTNDFGLMASVIHEYRSGIRFPVGASDVAIAPGYRTISTLLEIRILSATVTWQFRNVLGERYVQVPNFVMPRQTNFYGVRWYFSD
jgi:hypothetical protein